MRSRGLRAGGEAFLDAIAAPSSGRRGVSRCGGAARERARGRASEKATSPWGGGQGALRGECRPSPGAPGATLLTRGALPEGSGRSEEHVGPLPEGELPEAESCRPPQRRFGRKAGRFEPPRCAEGGALRAPEVCGRRGASGPVSRGRWAFCRSKGGLTFFSRPAQLGAGAPERQTRRYHHDSFVFPH
jgi:hypothetical protein